MDNAQARYLRYGSRVTGFRRGSNYLLRARERRNGGKLVLHIYACMAFFDAMELKRYRYCIIQVSDLRFSQIPRVWHETEFHQRRLGLPRPRTAYRSAKLACKTKQPRVGLEELFRCSKSAIF